MNTIVERLCRPEGYLFSSGRWTSRHGRGQTLYSNPAEVAQHRPILYSPVLWTPSVIHVVFSEVLAAHLSFRLFLRPQDPSMRRTAQGPQSNRTARHMPEHL